MSMVFKVKSVVCPNCGGHRKPEYLQVLPRVIDCVSCPDQFLARVVPKINVQTNKLDGEWYSGDKEIVDVSPAHP